MYTKKCAQSRRRANSLTERSIDRSKGKKISVLLPKAVAEYFSDKNIHFVAVISLSR